MNNTLSLKHIFFVALVPLIYLILIISLFTFLDQNKLVEILTSERTLYSLKLSISCASIVAITSTILAIPIAYLLSRNQFYMKNVIDTLLELPLVVSPAALGAMILIFFNTKYGKYIQDNMVQVVFSINGIIVAQVISTIGISIRLIKSVMDEIPIRYENIARTLGANSFQSFKTIMLPLSKKGIMASFILVWAKSIGEFGATITVAGTMPFYTETLPIAIYLRLSSADIEGAVVLILTIIAIGLLALSLFRFLSRKTIL